jgi:hypothetical protein
MASASVCEPPTPLPAPVLLPGQGFMDADQLRKFGLNIKPLDLAPFLSGPVPGRQEDGYDVANFLSDRFTRYTEQWYRENYPAFSDEECAVLALYSAGFRYKQLKSLLKKARARAAVAQAALKL